MDEVAQQSLGRVAMERALDEEGAVAAFEVLPLEAYVAAHYDELRRFASFVTFPPIEPDDVLHDALVALLRRARATHGRDPGSYVRRSIVNAARSRGRRTRRRDMLGWGTALSAGSVVDGYPSDAWSLLEGLPAESRAALWLADVEGASSEEIAATLGLSSGAVRARLSRARRTISERLRDEGS